MRVIKGMLLIVFVLLLIFLISNLDKGWETHAPDRIVVSAGQELENTVGRIPGTKVIDAELGIVQVPYGETEAYMAKFYQHLEVLNVSKIPVEANFRFSKYAYELNKVFQGYLTSDWGTLTYPGDIRNGQLFKQFPVNTSLDFMIKSSFSYLGWALLFGVTAGYLLALLAAWKPLVGRVLDGFHKLLLCLPDFFVIVLMQMIAMQISKAAGHNVILIMQFGGETPFLIPFLAIAIMPGVLLYGTLRLAVKREWQEGYIATAYSKGLGRTRVLLVHLMRNTVEDLLAVMPRAVTAGITSLVIAEVMVGIYGLGGYALNPKLLNVTSLPVTCALLALTGLVVHFALHYVRSRFTVRVKEGA